MSIVLDQADRESYDLEKWCMALHGNHDEHQCRKKPGHLHSGVEYSANHKCYCGVWWR